MSSVFCCSGFGSPLLLLLVRTLRVILLLITLGFGKALLRSIVLLRSSCIPSKIFQNKDCKAILFSNIFPLISKNLWRCLPWYSAGSSRWNGRPSSPRCSFPFCSLLQTPLWLRYNQALSKLVFVLSTRHPWLNSTDLSWACPCGLFPLHLKLIKLQRRLNYGRDKWKQSSTI